MVQYVEHPYSEKFVRSTDLVVLHEVYQRPLFQENAKLIAANFDSRLLNDPKVSKRDGKFYVFDGQTTIEALKILAGTDDIAIRCRVFEGMTVEEEALLFAAQFGSSRPVAPGYLLRARIVGKDATALAFLAALESAGFEPSYSQQPGDNRIACITTAFSYFRTMEPECFNEALLIMKEAWYGESGSLHRSNLAGICEFVTRYRGEYGHDRLVKRLRRAGAMRIHQKGRLAGSRLPGNIKYLDQVVQIYNGTSKRRALPLKY